MPRREDLPVERLTLDRAATHLLEECRTIVPGVQALFGFQLIAVFSQRFADALSPFEQRMHLGAIVLVVVAMALVMAPAALHRQAEPRTVSERFLRVAQRLLLSSMVALSLGLALDIYLVARVVFGTQRPAAMTASALLLVLALLWLVLPHSLTLQRLVGGNHADR